MVSMAYFPSRLLQYFDKQRKTLGLAKQEYSFFQSNTGVVEFYTNEGVMVDVFNIDFNAKTVKHKYKQNSMSQSINNSFDLKDIKQYFEQMQANRVREKAPE